MVETPGTAPGSTTIIPRSVYHHSQGASPSGTDEHKEHGGGLQELRKGASARSTTRLVWRNTDGAPPVPVLLSQREQALQIFELNVKGFPGFMKCGEDILPAQFGCGFCRR